MKKTAVAVLTFVLVVLGAPASAMQVIGHGGDRSGGTSPDSLKSQNKAYDLGACAESDGRLTSENDPAKAVNSHDEDASHEGTAPRGFLIHDHTLAQLRQYHLDDGQQYATIVQSMKILQHRPKACLYMELKSLAWTGHMIHWLQTKAVNMGITKQFRLYLAWAPLVERARDHAPKLRVAWKMKGETDLQRIHQYRVWAVVPRWGGIYKNNIIRIHRIGVKVFAPVSQEKRWDKIEHLQKVANLNGFLTNSVIKATRRF